MGIHVFALSPGNDALLHPWVEMYSNSYGILVLLGGHFHTGIIKITKIMEFHDFHIFHENTWKLWKFSIFVILSSRCESDPKKYQNSIGIPIRFHPRRQKGTISRKVHILWIFHGISQNGRSSMNFQLFVETCSFRIPLRKCN